MIMKCLAILVVMLCVFQPINGEERRKDPLVEKEIRDPSSRHYVPHPYPKTNEEIIANLKYQAKIRESLRKLRKSTIPRKRPPVIDIVEGKTPYRVGRIIKVKNRAMYIPFDYSWLIFIMDQNEKIYIVLGMDANGRYTGRQTKPHKEADIQGLLRTRREILDSLSKKLDRRITRHDITQMERILFQSFGDSQRSQRSLGGKPIMWEIKLADKTIYYYVYTDVFYEIATKKNFIWDKFIPWACPEDYPTAGYDFVTDTINDEVIVLKRL